jgi:hypothetical protein
VQTPKGVSLVTPIPHCLLQNAPPLLHEHDHWILTTTVQKSRRPSKAQEPRVMVLLNPLEKLNCSMLGNALLKSVCIAVGYALEVNMVSRSSTSISSNAVKTAHLLVWYTNSTPPLILIPYCPTSARSSPIHARSWITAVLAAIF